MQKLSEFIEGEVYYRITFPDVELKIPLMESFVFIGINLSEEDKDNTWYFQFAEGYAKDGSILETEGGDRKTRCLGCAELGEMLDIDGLTKELQGAKKRREK